MSSLFTTSKHAQLKTEFGSNRPIPFYLQFVPGNVIDVVHSDESLRYRGDDTINTIIAKPHITNKSGNRKSSNGEDFRYYPLLRGITDVPSKGDPVLLCTIGKINYYLGPINTINNSPTWNTDPSSKRETLFGNRSVGSTTVDGLLGESPNFNKEISYNRLSKFRNDELDYGDAVRETTGDTIIEGRHGNSLRIGSRSNNPYMFISNQRYPDNDLETLGDGTIIGITSNGTLQQHFPNYFVNLPVYEDEDEVNENENNEKVFGFTLASDLYLSNQQSPNRFMGSLISSINNDQDTNELIYNYSGNQMLLHSDRITINSKLDDIYLSSNKDIHIGTKRHLTISTNENLIIESEKTYLGNPNKATMESMVLGEKLKEVLNDIINLLPTIKIPTMLGPQFPMPDLQTQVTNITNKINNITSTKHKIEQG